jgi:sugar lactone lactonase YvrE
MSRRELRLLREGGAFFEGPRWHEGRWWVSDFYRRAVFAVDTDGREHQVLSVEGQPSGLAWLPDGSLLVVSMKDRRLLRRAPSGQVSVHAEVGRFCGGPLNDLVVDTKGRAFVGNFGFDLMARENRSRRVSSGSTQTGRRFSPPTTFSSPTAR